VLVLGEDGYGLPLPDCRPYDQELLRLEDFLVPARTSWTLSCQSDAGTLLRLFVVLCRSERMRVGAVGVHHPQVDRVGVLVVARIDDLAPIGRPRGSAPVVLVVDDLVLTAPVCIHHPNAVVWIVAALPDRVPGDLQSVG
jgi:hypothetical protein